ncbi:MAG TPA: molybdopterin-synthase adenylyltransferase MoeB [Saprospiraceae bacterium]|nr:molybdopterin-synthase adenylyltransferase MoeB [Saprospiraceae bacterium]
MSQITFSKQELERYSRHLIIPEFNIEGQRKLKGARVLVVGTGGLGAPLLQYLTAAGVGTIGIVDFDIVDESNLQRQVLFTVDDIGKPKVEVAKQRLEKLNPHLTFRTYNTHLNASNALEIIKDFDVVADGTDNFPTRYLVNDACVILGKVNVYASIFRFEGQASVFNYLYADGSRGPNYRDLFPVPPPPGLVPSCAEGGVLGVLPGILGSLQANEVIKVITGVGETLAGRLFLFDAAGFTTRILRIAKDQTAKAITQLIDYEEFCGIPQQVMADESQSGARQNGVREVTVQQLAQLITSGADFDLIDVREPYEYDIVNINGRLIPKGEIKDHVDEISRQRQVVVHCRSGKRSADVVRELQDKYGFENLYNLKGGVLAWAKEIDHSLPVY